MKRIFACVMFLFITLFVSGCSIVSNDAKIESIGIMTSELPTEFVQGEYVIEDIIDRIFLEVRKNNGEVFKIKVNETMITEEDILKLTTPGIHTIRVEYEGFVTDFVITITEEKFLKEHRAFFYGYDGSFIFELTISKDTPISAFPEAPLVRGYEFVGWSVGFEEVINADGDVYINALYIEKSREITFYGKDGEVLEMITLYGDDVLKEYPAVIAYPGYSFIGFDIELDEINNADTNFEVHALYKKDDVIRKVLFYDYMGAIVYELKLVNDDVLKELPKGSDSPDGEMIFDSWDSTLEEINMSTLEVIEVHGKYRPSNYLRVYILGYNSEVIDTIDTITGSFYYFPYVEDYSEEYKFVGFDMSVEEVNSLKGEVYVKALYEFVPIMYKVTFHNQDGSVLDEVEIIKGGDLSKLHHLYEPGFVFMGWSEDLKEVNSNKNVYPIFVSEDDPDLTFKVTFVDDLGIVIEEVTVGYEDKCDAPVAPTKEGYIFVSWDCQLGKLQSVTSNLTVAANYEKIENDDISYKVTFLGLNDEIIDERIFIKNKYASFPEAPSLRGYDFIKYDKTIEELESEASFQLVKAVYNKNDIPTDKYKVRLFSFYTGYLIDEFWVQENETVVLPEAPYVYGYDFVKWDVHQYNLNHIRMDLDIHPIYKIRDFSPRDITIRYCDRSGQLILETVYNTANDINTIQEPIAPTLSGRQFVGWDKDIDQILNCSGTISLNACYITLGSSTSSTIVFTTSLGAVIKTAQFSKGSFKGDYPEPYIFDQYNFVGWSKSVEEINFLSKKTNEVIYVRQVNEWKEVKPIECRVKFLGLGDSVIESRVVRIGSSITYPEVPEILGYVFTSWDKVITVANKDEVIKANYVDDPNRDNYKVTFMVDGEVYYEVVVTPDNMGNVTYPESPNKEGYRFTGWDASIEHIKSSKKDITVNAKFTKILSHKVYYCTKNGKIIRTDTVEQGTSYSIPTNLQNNELLHVYKKDFVKWDKSLEQIVSSTEDIYVYPVYKDTAIYHVKLIGRNGDVILDMELFQESLNNFSFPDIKNSETWSDYKEVNDYEFSHWSMTEDEIKPITKDVTVYAIYVPIPKININYLSKDGTIIKTIQMVRGKQLPENEPSGPEVMGLKFIKWDKSPDDIKGSTEEVFVNPIYEVDNPFIGKWISLETNDILEFTTYNDYYFNQYKNNYILTIGKIAASSYLNAFGCESEVEFWFDNDKVTMKGLYSGELEFVKLEDSNKHYRIDELINNSEVYEKEQGELINTYATFTGELSQYEKCYMFKDSDGNILNIMPDYIIIGTTPGQKVTLDNKIFEGDTVRISGNLGHTNNGAVTLINPEFDLVREKPDVVKKVIVYGDNFEVVGSHTLTSDASLSKYEVSNVLVHKGQIVSVNTFINDTDLGINALYNIKRTGFAKFLYYPSTGTISIDGYNDFIYDLKYDLCSTIIDDKEYVFKFFTTPKQYTYDATLDTVSLYIDGIYQGMTRYEYENNLSLKFTIKNNDYIITYNENDNSMYCNNLLLQKTSNKDYLYYNVYYLLDGKIASSERVLHGNGAVNIPSQGVLGKDDIFGNDKKLIGLYYPVTNIQKDFTVSIIYVNLNDVSKVVGTYTSDNGVLILNDDNTYEYRKTIDIGEAIESGYYEYDELNNYVKFIKTKNEVVATNPENSYVKTYVNYFEEESHSINDYAIWDRTDDIVYKKEGVTLDNTYYYREYGREEQKFTFSYNELNQPVYKYYSYGSSVYGSIVFFDELQGRVRTVFDYKNENIISSQNYAIGLYEISYYPLTNKITWTFSNPETVDVTLEDLYNSDVYENNPKNTVYNITGVISSIEEKETVITSNGYKIIIPNTKIINYGINRRITITSVVKKIVEGESVTFYTNTSPVTTDLSIEFDIQDIVGEYILDDNYYSVYLTVNSDKTFTMISEFTSNKRFQTGVIIDDKFVITHDYYETQGEFGPWISNEKIGSIDAPVEEATFKLYDYSILFSYLFSRSSVRFMKIQSALDNRKYYLVPEGENITDYIKDEYMFNRGSNKYIYEVFARIDASKTYNAMYFDEECNEYKTYISFDFSNEKKKVVYCVLRFDVSERSGDQSILVREEKADRVLVQDAIRIVDGTEENLKDKYYEAILKLEEVVDINKGIYIFKDINNEPIKVQHKTLDKNIESFAHLNLLKGEEYLIHGKVRRVDGDVSFVNASVEIYNIFNDIAGGYRTYNPDGTVDRIDISVNGRFTFKKSYLPNQSYPNDFYDGSIKKQDGELLISLNKKVRNYSNNTSKIPFEFTDGKKITITDKGICYDGKEYILDGVIGYYVKIYDKDTLELVTGSYFTFNIYETLHPLSVLFTNLLDDYEMLYDQNMNIISKDELINFNRDLIFYVSK